MPFINMKTTATLDIAKKMPCPKHSAPLPETALAKVRTG